MDSMSRNRLRAKITQHMTKQNVIQEMNGLDKGAVLEWTRKALWRR